MTSPADETLGADGGTPQLITEAARTTEGPSHYTHVYFRQADDRWDVECSICDFKVSDLSAFEAADDTANWHQGLPSYIGTVTHALVGNCIGCEHDLRTGPCGGCGAIDALEAPDDVG